MWIWIGVHPFGVMIVDIGGVNMKLKFIEKEPTTWGISSSRAKLLKLGETYDVERIEVHSCHTKVFLKEFPCVEFNSVWFEEV